MRKGRNKFRYGQKREFYNYVEIENLKKYKERERCINRERKRERERETEGDA
jgi:hypothetical protein